MSIKFEFIFGIGMLSEAVFDGLFIDGV